MASWSLLLFVLAVVTASSSSQQDDSPTVQIPQGTLLGTSNSTADGTKYYKFLGIPYAKPPLGALRFKAPLDPDSWDGVRNASSFGSSCMQPGSAGGSEDCLFVNIFTPQLPTSKNKGPLLPVMVYIHGGAFLVGSGDMSPGQLMNHGVVVASFNYRLNVFGFLSINGTDAPGNAGLKDQSTALRWIQEHIPTFGGDPNSITIFGASAGGASVHFNVLSRMSGGLFHRAISESGMASPWVFVKNTEDRAYRLGSVLGHNASSAKELIAVLRSASADVLVSSISKVPTAEENEALLTIPFVPSLEFPNNEEEPFLQHEPQYIEQNGLFNQVPYITGITKQEALLFVYYKVQVEPTYWQVVNNDLEQNVVPVNLGLSKGSRESLEVAQKVKSFYFGDKEISQKTIKLWAELQTNMLFDLPVVQTTRWHTEHSTSATYNYQFTFGDAYHTEEFHYVTYDDKIEGVHTDDAILARLLGRLWTNFAKTGVPSVEGEVVWNPVSDDSFPYLDINTTPALKCDIEKNRMEFWSDIFKNYSSYTPV